MTPRDRVPVFSLGLVVLALVLGLVAPARRSTSGSTTAIGDIAGAYRFEDGRTLVISSIGDGLYRYRDVATGESRRLYPSQRAKRPDGFPAGAESRMFHSGPGWSVAEPRVLRAAFSSRSGAALHWQEQDAPVRVAQRVPLREQILFFESQGSRLRAKIIYPEGPGPHPAIVLSPGSGRESFIEFAWEPYLFALNGVAGCAIDKRGTGGSQGRFTMDFRILAADLAGLAAQVAGLASIDPARIGFGGYSQGGWIAPLAATRRPGARFVVVGYGLATSPSAEERDETLNDLRDKGFSDADLAQARELIDAALRAAASNFGDGWKELQQFKARYREARWYPALKARWFSRDARVTGAALTYPRWLLRSVGRRFFPPGLIWDYDAMAVLRRLEIPQLWLIGGEDAEAPPAETLSRLEELRRMGRPVDVVVYPRSDHGIIEFEVKDGKRMYTRHPSTYMSTMAAWAKEKAG